MRKSFLVTALAVALSIQVQAQTGQTNPSGQPENSGQPGQMGQPTGPNMGGQPGHMGQPGGPTGQPGHMGPGQHGGPNTAGQQGQMGDQPQFDKTKCAPETKKLESGANACLGKKDFNQRRACFDQLGNKFQRGFFEACRETVEPLKQTVMAKEKQKYPKQASAVEGDKGGGHHTQAGGPGPHGQPGNMGRPGDQGGPHMGGQPGGPNMAGGPQGGSNMGQPGQPTEQWDPGKCAPETKKMASKAESCLSKKNFNQRKACFDEVGNKFARAFWETCRDTIEPVKSAILSKEKAKYPAQPSALDGGKDGQQQAGGPGTPGGPNGDTQANMKPPQGKPMNCDKLAADTRKNGEKCLGMKDQMKRKGCFDLIGQNIEKTGGQCNEKIDPLKAEFQSKEASKYPDQPRSIQ